ncbi:MAG: fibronectin type III domain-containing protein [Pseudomonadales bacterium]
MKNLLQYFLISVLLLLTACGGGGSSNNSSQGQVVVTTTANSTSKAVTVEADVSPLGGGINQTEVTIETTSSITISWTPPAMNANGDPLDPSEISGYEIYYSSEDSTASGGDIVYVDLGTTTEMTIDDLSPGTYQFSISAIESGS